MMTFLPWNRQDNDDDRESGSTHVTCEKRKDSWAKLRVCMSDLGSERDLHCICKLLNARQDSCSAIDAKLDLLGKVPGLKLL